MVSQRRRASMPETLTSHNARAATVIIAAIIFLPRRPYALCVMSTWGPADRRAQEEFVAGIATLVHERMTTLDVTSAFGQGIPGALR